MRSRFLVLLTLVLSGWIHAAEAELGDLVLVRGNRSRWTIVVPDKAQVHEREAAERLAAMLLEITGARLELRAESESEPEGRRILVGQTRAAVAASLDLEPLGKDGFMVRAVHGDVLVFGGGSRGTDFAVTGLLEEFGCRMWAPGALFVPKRDELSLASDYSKIEVPPTAWRSVHYGVADDPQYRSWHRLDWIADELGKTRAPGWVHSMLSFVPEDEYFEEHPEYFALVDGERRPTQLCLDNPDVLRLTIEGIEQLLTENPGLRTISVSQADNQAYCRCAAELELCAREGSPMGPLLRFVNAVAKVFPERTISTLAYQYTRKPPATIRPRSNVSLMLCTLEEDRSRPIAANPDSRFLADFERWSELSPNIFLWDYEVQFTNLLAPFPNLHVLQPNVRWFAANHIQSLFLQGNGVHTELAELRCYLLAKLAWNPDIDVSATIDQFLEGFYGPAATMLRGYLDLLHDELAASGQELRIFGAPAAARDTWLRPEVLAKAERLFDAARHAVAGDHELEQRVRFARLPVAFAYLECARSRGALPNGIWQGSSEGGWEIVPGLRERVDEFLRVAEEAQQPVLREWGRSLAEYRAQWDTLLNTSLPAQRAFGCRVEASLAPTRLALGNLTDGLPGGDRFDDGWVTWQASELYLVLDLGPGERPRKLHFRMLEDPERRLVLPRVVRLSSSPDGSTWQSLGRLAAAPDTETMGRASYAVAFSGESLRYVRLELHGAAARPTDSPEAWGLDELYVD